MMVMDDNDDDDCDDGDEALHSAINGNISERCFKGFRREFHFIVTFGRLSARCCLSRAVLLESSNE